MKKIIALIILLTFSNSVLAEYVGNCDVSTIQQQGDNYIYNKDCHIEVGRLVKENKQQKQQIDDLNKAVAAKNDESTHLRKTITLKDLALDKADERTSKWREESYSQNSSLNKEQRLSRYENYFFFASGIAVTVLAVFAAGSIRR
jgi:hypothetical protein